MQTERQRAKVAITIPESGFLYKLYHTKNGRRLLKVITRPIFSKIAGAFLSTPLSIPLIAPFVKKNHIDLSQCKAQRFLTYNRFFSRELVEGARPIHPDKSAFISPCDSKCTIYPLAEDTTFVVKGVPYTVSELLAEAPIGVQFPPSVAPDSKPK